MPTFSQRSLDALETCDKRLQAIAHDAIKEWDFTVLKCFRSRKDQERELREGTSTLPWGRSKHNSLPSLAMDLAPWYPEVPAGGVDWRTDAALWTAAQQTDWTLMEEILENIKRWQTFSGFIRGIAYAKGVRLRSGADWNTDERFNDHSLVDLPHFEIET